WRLVAAPKQAVPFVRAKLRPPPVDAAEIARLLADLGDGRFAVRERAMTELNKKGPAAIPALRKALTGQPPAETGGRVQQLLARLDRWPGAPVLRALQVLEQVGTPDARHALEGLAKELSDRHLVREARASLARLAKRHAAPP